MSAFVALTVGAAAILAGSSAVAQESVSKGNIVDLKADAKSTTAAQPPLRVQQLTAQAVSCYTDPRGDTIPGDYPRADITGFCAVHTGTEIGLSVQVVSPTNPATDPNWTGLTGLLWDLYLTSAGTTASDYQVYANSDGAEVQDVNGTVVCEAPLTATSSGFDVKFPASCIGNAQSFFMDTFIIYDSNPNDVNAPTYADITDTVGPIRASATTPPPVVTPPPSGTQRATGRLAGADRYSTAVAISQNVFGSGAPIVFLARADSFADALAGGTLSRGPILLVPQCGTVPAVVLAEVRRLGATEVVALGGASAVCDSVLQQVARA